MSYIEKDTTDEQFFEPVNPDVWEQVTFANQHDISYAIMGYRLGPSDVKVCPRTPQVRDIIRQLSIVDYVVVQGESGCGKSISAYQAAYDYYLNGWIIYRYKDTNSIIESKLPENTEKSLYIIDDAQKLSSSVIYELTEQAHDNRKIIIAKTISDIFSFDTILITNTDAVKILYKTYLSRKNEILPIVQKCDKSVGVDFFTTPFDMRLNNAKEASTPWQFNYILRGGWNTMRGLYLTSCPRKSQRLLVAFIATFQILSLDNSVDYNWLCFYITSLDPSISWGREDLIHLVDKKIIISEDNPRIIHIESAKVVLAQFLEDSDINERSILCSAIEQAVLDKKVSPLGLVWLYNGLLPYIYILKDMKNS